MRALWIIPLLCLSQVAQAQQPGMPGTPTPQPYAQPQIRSLPMTPQGSPPLLVKPGQPSSRVPAAAPRPLPKDQPLPALETQRRSQQSHPAESIDRP